MFPLQPWKQIKHINKPASHEEGSRNGRVEVATRDPRGRIDQNSQAQTIADGGSGQASAHGVGIAASTKEGEEEHAEKLGKHITKRDGICHIANSSDQSFPLSLTQQAHKACITRDPCEF